MAKYEVQWTEERWKSTIIEADSQEQALEAFWNGEFDSINDNGGEIHIGVTVEEAK